MTDDISIWVKFKDSASKGFKDLNNNLDKTDKKAKNTSKGLKTFGQAVAAIGAAVAGGAFLKDSISTFASFDDNMRAATAVTNAAGVEIEKLRSIALEMGKTTRYSASEAAEGLKFLGMAGLSATDATEALPGVLNLAAAGSMDLGTAADIATNVLTSFGMKVEDLGKVNDVLAKTFTSAAVNMVEIGEAFKEAGSISKSVGEDFEDLTGTIGALGNANIRGSAAGTSLKNAIKALLAPTASQLEVQRELAQRIGQTNLVVKDSEGKFIGFRKVIEQLEKAGMDGKEAIEAFGMEAGPGMAALVTQGSDSLKKLVMDLKESEGTAKTLSEKMEAGLGGSLRETAAAIESLKIALVDALDEEIIEFLETFRNSLERVIKLINDLAAKGVFKTWGESASWVLNKMTEGVERVYNHLQLFITGGSSILWALAGDMDAARLAYSDYETTVKKLRGTYVESHDQMEVVTKKVTAKMLAQREELHKTKEAAEEFSEVIIGYRTDGTAITVLERKVKELGSAVGTGTNAVKVGKEEFKAWKKEAKAAYDEAKGYAKDYAEKVKEFETSIKNNRIETADTIRSIGRKGMTDEQAWNDRKREAEEKLSAARQALYNDDYELAEQLAKDAQSLYAGLAEEVTKEGKSGEDVVVKSLEATKKVAINGLEEVGSFNESLYEEQKKNAENSQNTWEEVADRINTKLEELTKDREQNVIITLDNINSVKSEIERLTRNETKTITIKTVTVSSGSSSDSSADTSNKEGGMIHKFSNGSYIPRSGFLSGYGGGDKVKALLESGEGIIRKEAMKIIGEDRLNEWNALRFNLGGAVPDSSPSNIGGSFLTPGNGPGEVITLRFQAGEEEASVQISDTDSKLSLKAFSELLERKRLTNVE